MAKLTLTLDKDLTAEAMERLVQRARKLGAQDVRPLFPDAPLAELKRFYELDVPDDRVKEVAAGLQALDGVVAVEGSKPRRPLHR